LKATDVYNIAIALPSEELSLLYNMLGKKVMSIPDSGIKKRRKCLPRFTIDDGLRYLLENIIDKNREQDDS